LKAEFEFLYTGPLAVALNRRRPSADELARLWHEVKSPPISRAERAWRALVECNLRLVVSIAKRYRNRGVEFEDLVSAGTIGLMRAVDKFEVEHGFKFATYAVHWIRQTMQREIEDRGALIRIPENVVQAVTKVHAARGRLLTMLGREPTVEELAQATGLSVRKVKRALDVPVASTSLDAPHSDDGEHCTLLDAVRDEEPDAEEQLGDRERERQAAALLARRTRREQAIVRARCEGKTLTDIAPAHGVTRERVRQIEAKAVRMLRRDARLSELPVGG
jgi:RNA polymerase primary sigma factor